MHLQMHGAYAARVGLYGDILDCPCLVSRRGDREIIGATALRGALSPGVIAISSGQGKGIRERTIHDGGNRLHRATLARYRVPDFQDEVRIDTREARTWHIV